LKSNSRPRASFVRRVFAAAAIVAVSAGCRQDMHDAPRYDPLESSPVFAKGASALPLQEGTIARGELRADEHLHTGKVGADHATTFPFAITRADLDRGQERYDIYCAPCHSKTGDGNGMVVQRGYRQAATFHIERLRSVPVGYFFDVMTKGYGAMPDYAAQIVPEDRWRIAAYLRVLQLSQHATTGDVPAAELQRLQSGEPAPAPAPAKPGGHGGQ
jgi:mono/diheme cytochrome c family protein